jgi:hypothetical protein
MAASDASEKNPPGRSWTAAMFAKGMLDRVPDASVNDRAGSVKSPYIDSP